MHPTTLETTISISTNSDEVDSDDSKSKWVDAGDVGGKSVSPMALQEVQDDPALSFNDKENKNKDMSQKLHDHTYGITSDPLTQFACVFSALVHDGAFRDVFICLETSLCVGHSPCLPSNTQLTIEVYPIRNLSLKIRALLHSTRINPLLSRSQLISPGTC